MTIDLERLAIDLDTATPHQSPPWQDALSPAERQSVIRRAEQIAASDRVIRVAMRKP